MSMQEAPHGVPTWELHHRLGRSLEFAGIKVQEMRDHIGVSDSTMSNYLSGKTQPRLGMLRVWAIRCGVPFPWLADGSEDSPDPGGLGIHSSACVTEGSNVTHLTRARSLHDEREAA